MRGKLKTGLMPVVIFDGTEEGNVVCPFINIWKSYGDRSQGISGFVAHGAQGLLLKREGNRCKVQARTLPDGELATGYVTYYFLKELKGDW